MPRTEAQKRARAKYTASHMKRIPLEVKKEFYNNVLKPAADAAGESVNGYIKKAISERLERPTE